MQERRQAHTGGTHRLHGNCFRRCRINAHARELVAFLRRNGYREERQTGLHLVLKHFTRPTVVIPIHRGKDLPKGLFLRILKDSGFTIDDFREK